jgi:hypothetical protein
VGTGMARAFATKSFVTVVITSMGTGMAGAFAMKSFVTVAVSFVSAAMAGASAMKLFLTVVKSSLMIESARTWCLCKGLLCACRTSDVQKSSEKTQ